MTDPGHFLVRSTLILLPTKQKGRNQDNTCKSDHESNKLFKLLLLAVLKRVLLDRKILMRCLSLELYQFSAQYPFEKLYCYSPASYNHLLLQRKYKHGPNAAVLICS